MLQLAERLILWLLSLLPKTPMSTASTVLSSAEALLDSAVPVVGTVTAGLKLTDDVVNAAMTVRSSYQTPGMILDATQKKRLVAAQTILDMQKRNDVKAEQNQLGGLSSILVLCVAAWALEGCSFFAPVTPTHNAGTASIDSSTPPQYGSDVTSGYLGDEISLDGVRHHLITSRGRGIYNRAMVRYAPQLQAYFNVAPVAPDAGLTPYVDRFGNHVYQLDDEHMQDFLRAGDIADNPALYPYPVPATPVNPAPAAK